MIITTTTNNNKGSVQIITSFALINLMAWRRKLSVVRLKTPVPKGSFASKTKKTCSWVYTTQLWHGQCLNCSDELVTYIHDTGCAKEPQSGKGHLFHHLQVEKLAENKVVMMQMVVNKPCYQKNEVKTL